MAVPSDFSPEDWNAIAELPKRVGIAVMQTSQSGPLQFAEELITLTESVIDAVLSEEPLIHAVAAYHRDRTDEFKVDSLPADEAPLFRQSVMEHCRKVVALLNAQVSEGESLAYREWCYQIAVKVAEAAKEGGFLLLFGGVRVTDEEKQTLAELAAALDVTPPAVAPSPSPA